MNVASWQIGRLMQMPARLPKAQLLEGDYSALKTSTLHCTQAQCHVCPGWPGPAVQPLVT